MSFFLPSAGPLANDMDALSILCRAVMGARPALYDSTALDISWCDLQIPSATKKLKLGVLGEDPVFPLHPPVKRALADAVKMLEGQGHQAVKIPASRAHVANALALAFAYFSLDDTALSHIAASGEPIIPSIIQGGEDFAKFKSQSHFLDDIEGLEGVAKIAALNVKRHTIAEEWRRIWKEEGLDAVIGPGAQNTAVRHDTYGLPPYTLLLNVLDYPACIIPFGRASSELAPEPLITGPGQVGPNYEPSAVHGAPTAIQVFTSKMRDEECLRVASMIDKCLNGEVQFGKARVHRI
jgi:amidase